MDLVAKDVDADDDTPEVSGQERNVEEGGAAHSEDEGRESVEEAQAEGVADEPAVDGTVPGRLLERMAVEDGSLNAIDTHTKETHEGKNVVHGSPGN